MPAVVYPRVTLESGDLLDVDLARHDEIVGAIRRAGRLTVGAPALPRRIAAGFARAAASIIYAKPWAAAYLTAEQRAAVDAALV